MGIGKKGGNDQKKTPPEYKTNEARSGPTAIGEKSINGENKEPKKEVVLSDLSEKDNASWIQSDSWVEEVKEGGNQG